MIDINDLRDKQGIFLTTDQPGLITNFTRLENIRKIFVNRFSIEKLKTLPIERYVSGKKDSFCYWLEIRLAELGKIQGGATAPLKYGVYFGKTKQDSTKTYRALAKWGSDPHEAYRNVKQEIINLLKAGRKRDLNAIQANILSPMFKGKILATYYPQDYLSIFSEKYVDYYLHQLELGEYADMMYSVEQKRDELRKFKDRDTVMKRWSHYEFMKFLTTRFGGPAHKKTKVPPEIKPYIPLSLPPIETVKPEFKKPTFDRVMKKMQPSQSRKKHRHKTDYEEKGRRAKQIGDRGELIVVRFEREYLRSLGFTELKVEHVALNDDSAGFDILSYDEQRNKRYIEVKSTTAVYGEMAFIISANEFDRFRRKSNYVIYLVFEADTRHPTIVPVSFKNLSKNKLTVDPINYRIKIKPSVSF